MNACFGCIYCVPQASVGIIEDFGQFKDVAPPGLACLNPCRGTMQGPLSLKTQSMVCRLTSRTKESSVVTISVTIIYHVIPAKVHLAYYTMRTPQQQITTMVENALRAQIPHYTLNEVFLSQSEIADKAMIDLSRTFESKYGYRIVDLLVTDISPARELVQAMNQQAEARLQRVVAQHKGDMVRIEQKAAAEAQAEAARLSGVGLAAMRDALSKGLVTGVANHGQGVSERETMAVILMNQYFDTSSMIAQSKGSHIIFNQSNMLPAPIEYDMASTMSDVSGSRAGLRQRIQQPSLAEEGTQNSDIYSSL